MKPATTLAHLLLAATPLTAQLPLQGNGIGEAFLTHTTARIGGTIDFALGSPLAPAGIAVLGISDALLPSTHPLVGAVALDLSGAFQSEAFVLDNQGTAFPGQQIPNIPSLVQLPPVFAQLVVFEPGNQFSVSKATRVAWEVPDSFSPAGAMNAARAAHTATALGGSDRDQEVRVLITGGGGGTLLVPIATDTTELFDPVTRTTTTGPVMATARALHAAVRLPDGRVLVTGGTDSAGNVTTSAEIYDPLTNAFVAAPPMQQPRVGHAATLLDNGKVLVSGGLTNYQNPAQNLAALLNTAQANAELFDPLTQTWTSVPGVMANGRSGHAQTLLADGRVLISGGIQGGQQHPFGFQIPIYSQSCTIYDPVANSLSPTGSLLSARAFHGASLLPSGDVLVVGGSVLLLSFGLVSATDSCERFNGATWAATGPLPAGLTNPAYVRHADGRALLFGGLTGTFPTFVGADVVGYHDGTSFAPATALGMNPARGVTTSSPRGAAVAVRLYDSTHVLIGGTDGAAPLADCFVYQH